MRKYFFSRFLLLFIFTIPLITSCYEQSLPPGVVATVNGEPIALHSLQTLMDSRSASLGVAPRPSLLETQKKYGQALSVLIAHALVRQELASLNMSVNKTEVDNLIKEINADWEGENLDAFFAESSIRKDDWQQLMADYLALEKFKNHILLPGIKIKLEEIREYYTTHKKDFTLPATLRVCFLTSENEKDLAAWCSDLSNPNTFAASQCVDAPMEEIPQEWQSELKNLKPRSCSKFRNEYGEWRAIALMQKDKSRILSLPQVYALIENILIKQKQDGEFDHWLKNKIDSSRIKVAPELNASLLVKEEEE